MQRCVRACLPMLQTYGTYNRPIFTARSSLEDTGQKSSFINPTVIWLISDGRRNWHTVVVHHQTYPAQWRICWHWWKIGSPEFVQNEKNSRQILWVHPSRSTEAVKLPIKSLTSALSWRTLCQIDQWFLLIYSLLNECLNVQFGYFFTASCSSSLALT